MHSSSSAVDTRTSRADLLPLVKLHSSHSRQDINLVLSILTKILK
jgi:hypothetical protein